MNSMNKFAPVLGMGVAAFLILATTVRSGESTKRSKGPLASLPSKPGKHLEKIKALGDNEWVNLGAPAADPKWGKARGRSWGARALILIPHMRGALFTGEGKHGFVKPDGYHMDDLWCYDINAHRWICLYPGMNTRTFSKRVKDKELAIDGYGQLRDRDGQAIPVHTLLHAFGALAYDSDRKKLAFIITTEERNRYFQGGLEYMEPGMKLLDEQMKGKKKVDYSPYYYDVATEKFERKPAKGSSYNTRRSFPHFLYIPGKKQFFVAGPYDVSRFDVARNEWTELKAKGPRPRGYDGNCCYDSKRNRIYRNDGDGPDAAKNGLMAYDLKTNTWSYLKPKGHGPEGAMTTNSAHMMYDAARDLVMVIQMTGVDLGIHAYDPKTNSWAKALPIPKDGPKFLGFAANVFYDPELNVFFCHVARDSEDDGIMWAYRYKVAKK